MADKVEIEIVSGDSSLTPDEMDIQKERLRQEAVKEARRQAVHDRAEASHRRAEQREADRQAELERRKERQARLDERSEKSALRAEEAAERAKQKELIRLKDREERKQKRALAEEEKKEQAVENAKKKRIKEQERATKQEEIDGRKSQTLRRRFINDMLGAFNQAHLGRRINHAIDFIQALFNQNPIQATVDMVGGDDSLTPDLGTFPSGEEIGREAGEAFNRTSKTGFQQIADSLKKAFTGGGGTPVSGPISNTNNQLGGSSTTLNQSSSFASRVSNFAKGLFGKDGKAGEDVVDAQEVKPGKREALKQSLKMASQKASDSPSFDFIGKTAKQARYGLSALGPKPGASSKSAATKGFSAGREFVLEGTGAFAGGAGAAAGGTGTGGIAGAFGSLGAAGPVGIGVAAVVAAIAGTVGAFYLVTKAVEGFAETIAEFPSELTFAKIDNELKMFAVNMNRAQEFGGDLANIEREKGKRQVMGAETMNAFMRAILPVMEEANETLTFLFKSVTDIAKFLSGFALKPLMDVLEKAFERLNWLTDTYENGQKVWLNIFDKYAPWISVILRKYGTTNPADVDDDILRELYKFMNQNSAVRALAKNPNVQFGADTL